MCKENEAILKWTSELEAGTLTLQRLWMYPWPELKNAITEFRASTITHSRLNPSQQFLWSNPISWFHQGDGMQISPNKIQIIQCYIRLLLVN